MPQLNVGIVPGGAIGSELTAVVRRAFIPSLFVQIYKSTPLLSLLIGNAQRAKGGVSQVTVPVQGTSFVSFAWSDYAGGFPQPVIQPGVQNAEFNLKVGVIPIAFMGMESLMQASETIIPLLKARLADSRTVALQSISSALFANNASALTTINGLPQAYDDGTNVTTFGGINRTAVGNGFWKSNLVTAAGAVLTRSAFIKYLVQLTTLSGGESPDFCVMSPSDWTTLMTDFMSVERYNTDPRSKYGQDDITNAGFRGLMLGSTPIFFDPWLAKGTAYLFNSKYLALYISEDAPFAFSGFYSAIPNLQIANIGVVITAMELVCTKPVSGTQIQGITGGAF